MTTFPHPLASRRFKQQRVVAMCSRCARGNIGFTLIELLAVTCLFFDGHVEAKRPDDFKEENFSILAR
jgi:prepilin-type processing-associated H-X9-DG protein